MRQWRTPRLFGAAVFGVIAVTLGALDSAGAQSATPDAQAIEVAHVTSCLGGNGRVDTNIVNTGDEAATYRLEFEGLSARQRTVAAGDWWRMPVTGRPDATYEVAVVRDGTEVSRQTVQVQCDSQPPAVATRPVQIVNACRNDRGFVLFQFLNSTERSVGWVIEFEGVANRSTTTAPFGQALRGVSGRPDGDWAVRIRADGVVVSEFTVPVACDGAVVPNLVWGFDDTAPQTPWTRPAFNVAYPDPAYGSTIRRITSAEGTRFDRNTYSRRQAENADGTWFLSYHGDGAYHVSDRVTGELVRSLSISPDSWPQWHPTDPTIIRHAADDNSSRGDLRLYETDVISGATSTIVDLTDRLQQRVPGALYLNDRAEASPSLNGDRWAWAVYDDDEEQVAVVTYELSTDTILGVLLADDFLDPSPLDALSMSLTGDYVVLQHWDATWVLDADMSNARLIFAGGEHSDIALGADGRDAYVYIDFTAGPNGGWLMSVDLDTLSETRIFDLYDDANTSIHISGKGFGKPGWVIASTYNCKEDPAPWSCEKVMAVELAPNGRVLNLVHTYNCGDDYWTEPHAVANREFTRVYFNSDSGSCGIDAEVYIVDVPEFD